MFLSKNQKKVLQILHKNGDTLLYSQLHKYNCFKTDYAIQSAVESLKGKKYINYVVYKVNPKTLYSKSNDEDEVVLDRFEYVNYLEPSNRLFISDEGLTFLEKRKHDLFMYWIPFTITTLIAVASLLCSIVSLIH